MVTTKKLQATVDLGVIRDEVPPELFRVRCARRAVIAEVLADGARGDPNAQLELQFVGNALLIPRSDSRHPSLG